MSRLFLALLLVVLAALLIPGVRERMQPGIDQGREWLGAKLEGPMSPVLDPYRRLKTESQLGEAVTELVRRRNLGSPPPEAGDFHDYLIAQELSEDGLDPWGSPYIMRQRPDSLDVISAGPDLQYDTGDDLIRSLRYADPRLRLLRSQRR